MTKHLHLGLLGRKIQFQNVRGLFRNGHFQVALTWTWTFYKLTEACRSHCVAFGLFYVHLSTKSTWCWTEFARMPLYGKVEGGTMCNTFLFPKNTAPVETNTQSPEVWLSTVFYLNLHKDYTKYNIKTLAVVTPFMLLCVSWTQTNRWRDLIWLDWFWH